jgi:hypothetical protein
MHIDHGDRFQVVSEAADHLVTISFVLSVRYEKECQTAEFLIKM